MMFVAEINTPDCSRQMLDTSSCATSYVWVTECVAIVQLEDFKCLLHSHVCTMLPLGIYHVHKQIGHALKCPD